MSPTNTEASLSTTEHVLYPSLESKYCLLLNESGRRFADETIGDEIINQYLAKQEKRRGFLIFKFVSHPPPLQMCFLTLYNPGSEKTRLQHCISALFPNAGDIDRLQKAREHGCNVGAASTLGELVEVLAGWGVDGVNAKRTIDNYDKVIRQREPGQGLDAPVGRGGTPPTPLGEGEGPFHAIEVQPS